MKNMCVLRGGSWFYIVTYNHVTHREYYFSTSDNYVLGFRLKLK